MALGREYDAVKAGLKAHNLFPSEPRYQEPFKPRQSETKMSR